MNVSKIPYYAKRVGGKFEVTKIKIVFPNIYIIGTLECISFMHLKDRPVYFIEVKPLFYHCFKNV